MLKIGDTIKCLNMVDFSEHYRALIKAGYKVDVNLMQYLITIKQIPEDPENE